MLGLKLGEIQDMMNVSPEDAQKELAEVAVELDGLREEDIRKLAHRLHPSIIGVGLVAAIRSLRDLYERWVPIRLEIVQDVFAREPPGSSTIPFDVRLGLYRVTDEILANVIKHAGATDVTVGLGIDEHTGDLRLIVQDNGAGFDLRDSPRGLGIVTMEDYMGAIGGSLQLDTAPGRGTRITADVPLDVDSGHPALDPHTP